MAPAEPAPPPPEPVKPAFGGIGYKNNPPPDYPTIAVRQGWQGTVLLRVRVLQTGAVESVEVMRSSGKKVLDDAAIHTVERWVFAPSTRGNAANRWIRHRAHRIQARFLIFIFAKGTNVFAHSSSIAVSATLWLLAAFSIATWILILAKATQFIRASGGNRRYVNTFRAASNLQSASEVPDNRSAFARLAAVGFGVLRHAPPADGADEHAWDRHELLERNLKQQVLRERRTLEGGLAVLASVGSTAPFVGLFGTVWGIMSAMKDISRIGNASIDVVAGPIGEALVATGIGIAVAIPAVLAFNFFVRRVKSVTADLDDFANDFLNLAQHAVLRVERRPQEVHRLQPVRGPGEQLEWPFPLPKTATC